MDIVIGMTAMAGGGQIFLHHPIGVAGTTGQFRMMMSQREIRRVVVEYMFIPTFHRVAAVALLAVFTRMNIRRFVTTYAGGFLKLIALTGVTT